MSALVKAKNDLSRESVANIGSAVLPTEAEVRACVGRHANYYLKQWRQLMEGNNIGADSHLASFLLPIFWFPYRKLWKLTAIVYAIIVFALIADHALFVIWLQGPSPQLFFRIALLLVGFICCWNSNDWYYQHVRRMVQEERASGVTGADYLKRLATRGGTSSIKATLLVVMLLVFFATLETTH